MSDPIEFPYKPNIGKMLFCIFFFGALFYFMTGQAFTNDHGMNFRGMQLNVREATHLLWFCSIISVVAVAIGIWAVIFSLISNGVLRLTATELQVPPTMLLNARTISYVDITLSRRIQVRNFEFLEILYKDKKIDINQDWLPTNEAFEQICQLVDERTSYDYVSKLRSSLPTSPPPTPDSSSSD